MSRPEALVRALIVDDEPLARRGIRKRLQAHPEVQRSVSPDVYKIGYYRPAGGEYRLSRMPWPEFLRYAEQVRASGRQAPATAPREIQVFDVLDRTASAKLTAAWGTDYLLLARTDGRWMVTHVLWQSPPPRPQP